jgi:Rrf2 family iron-sulfur cluster assembly transcriptional regulator
MEKNGECGCFEQCVTRHVWQGLGERIRNFLASVTLEELLLEARKKMTTHEELSVRQG